MGPSFALVTALKQLAFKFTLPGTNFVVHVNDQTYPGKLINLERNFIFS